MTHAEDTRFWAKVNKLPGDGCWEWTGAKNNRGYGKLTRHKKGYLAHRWGYMLQNGEIPEGKQVNHHCDNRVCVRGDHLYTGTQSQNVMDAVNRGRWVPKEYWDEDQVKWEAPSPAKNPKATRRAERVDTPTGKRWL